MSQDPQKPPAVITIFPKITSEKLHAHKT